MLIVKTEDHAKVGKLLVLLCLPSGQTMNDTSSLSGFNGKVGEITGTG
jgi:hypothetical protein